MRALSPDDKALRKAVINDWCARHGVECQPAPRVDISIEELVAISLQRGSWMGRSSIKTAIRAGAEPPPRTGTP